MPEIVLTSLSLDELKALHKRVNKTIETYADRQKAEALAALEAKARELGFSLSELTGAGKKSRTAGVPKYCHPTDPTQTWTGKGRQPNWIKEQLAHGKNMDAFLIAK